METPIMGSTGIIYNRAAGLSVLRTDVSIGLTLTLGKNSFVRGL